MGVRDGERGATGAPRMKYRTTWRRIPGPAYTYAAKVTAVHDGDTCSVDLDLGLSVHVLTAIRLLGCNAIELGDPGGVEAGQHLREVLLGQAVYLRTVKPDKYAGRMDAQVTVLADPTDPTSGYDLVTRLIADGWAAAWDGKGPKRVPSWPRVNATP
jgi:endonuclease YncB( thermonuclease family)